MRQLRFVVIALTTFLFVINAIFLRRTVAVVLCGILSFNSTSCYSFLTKAETANATVSPSKILEHSQSPQEAQNIYKYQAVNPLIASGKASSNTAPQYSFNLVARQGLVIGGQKVQDINTTIPWKQHRLIDENGRVVFQNNGTIFGDNQAIAFVGQTIGDYFIKEVKDYFLFKDGTLDILLRVGDASPSSYGHYIITRNSQILIDKSGDLFDVVPGYPDTYYVRSVTHNGYFLKNGVTEVSEMPKRKESSPPNLPGANPYGCISNDKNQNVCSGLNFGYLVRDGGKYLPSIGSPLAINNNGRVVTSLMQVLDYEKDALPSLQAALAKSGNSELEEIRARHRSDLSASDLSSPIYTNARIPYRVKIPYEKLFGTTFNSLTDKIRYLQLTDSGYMAIVLDEPVNRQIGSGVIIRATSSGSVAESNKKERLPEPGDVVMYQTSSFQWSPGKCTDQGCIPPQIPPREKSYYPHVAVIIEGGVKQNTDGTVTITRVRSKWNGGAIYDHDPNGTPYGKIWTVWRRNKKPNNCDPEKCNWLDVGPCDGRSDGKTCFKTDKQNDIYAGGEVEAKYTTDHPFPGVDIVIPKEKEPLKYDCRGFVFGRRTKPISEYFVLDNQVQEILDDGYTQLHAKDNEGNMH